MALEKRNLSARGFTYKTLEEIVAVDGSSGWKADRCLELASSLSSCDLARPEILMAAQTYALLEIAAAIDNTGAGRV